MRKTRFSEEQIIAVLREQEGGMKTADVCRKHGISSATLYAWKAKYGGMDVSQARKLKALEEATVKRFHYESHDQIRTHLRSPAQDAQRPHTLRIHRQDLDIRARPVHR